MPCPVELGKHKLLAQNWEATTSMHQTKFQIRTMFAGPATPGAKKAAESLAHRPESHRSYQEFQRSRAKLLRSVTQRRAQSTAVDFRRVWWDKDRRAPSRTGMSIWRPLPPTGYVSLGTPPASPDHPQTQIPLPIVLPAHPHALLHVWYAYRNLNASYVPTLHWPMHSRLHCPQEE